MTDQTPVLEYSPLKKLELLTQIAAGLLASGHFTTQEIDPELRGESQVLHGFDTQDDGRKKYYYPVARAAAEVLASLTSEITTDIKEEWDEHFI